MIPEGAAVSATPAVGAVTTIDRQRSAMRKHSLDALVAYSKENVAYGAGYVVPSQALAIRNRQFAVAVNADGEAAMLLTSNELQEAQARSTVDNFYPYDEFSDDPMETLAGALQDLGLAEARIGLEMDAIPADRWEALKALLPNVAWEHGTQAFEDARMVKTPAELDRLRKAARVADQAQADAHPSVREGMSEQELYRHVVDRALALGAEDVVMIQVAAGERSSYSNPTPSDVPLRRGDVVKIDAFVTEGGYFSDTGRSIVIGEATAEQREIWQAMQETLAEIHTSIKPGVSTRELWEVFVASFARRGKEPVIRFLGHGLGLSLHEEPFIAAHTDTVLEAGMVFAIEPVYRVGDIGYHLEDNVIVTESGCENMTGVFGPDLIVVG
jgi:Xaa-Pro aminopeptidase